MALRDFQGHWHLHISLVLLFVCLVMTIVSAGLVRWTIFIVSTTTPGVFIVFQVGLWRACNDQTGDCFDIEPAGPNDNINSSRALIVMSILMTFSAMVLCGVYICSEKYTNWTKILLYVIAGVELLSMIFLIACLGVYYNMNTFGSQTNWTLQMGGIMCIIVVVLLLFIIIFTFLERNRFKNKVRDDFRTRAHADRKEREYDDYWRGYDDGGNWVAAKNGAPPSSPPPQQQQQQQPPAGEPRVVTAQTNYGYSRRVVETPRPLDGDAEPPRGKFTPAMSVVF